nr:hypothetical protein [Candidatus Sigynarchaeota archaeon]
MKLIFNPKSEKIIRDLIRKFGLTKAEAEDFLKQSKDKFELKGILVLLAIIIGIIFVKCLYD